MNPGLLKSTALLSLVAIGMASMMLAQDQAAKPKAAIKGDVSDDLPDLVELSPFGGVSLFGQINRGLGEKLINGGTGGGRAAVNLSRHVGIELSYNFSGNNVRLVTPIAPGLPSYNFAQQSHAVSLDPVYNFTPRGSRIQPYVTAGFGFINFVPTKQALNFATNPANAIYRTTTLRRDLEVAFNYGGGVKVHISPHLGLRFDIRGLILPKNPTFGLPNFPNGGEYIVGKNTFSGLDATIGVVFYFGRHVVPGAPAPTNRIIGPISAGEITGGGGTLCQGKAITLHATTSDPENHALKYTWKLNGAVQAAEGPDFSFTPNNAGDNTVEVTVVDTTDATRVATVGPRTISVQDYTPPQIASVTASPTALTCASDTTGVHSAALTGAATGSACGGNLSYKWTVSEGSVTNDTNPNATFDGSNLNFESGSQSQAKTVTATLTVTDETGKSVSQTTNIAVTCPPVFKRLQDIVFAKNSARVNNCGKRILIDEAAQQAGSAYDILLVAHRSSDEKETIGVARKGKRATAARTLDEMRALNAAAVLMNDTKTCGTVDGSQVKIDTEGTDQSSTPEPGLCGTSNLPAQKERKGSVVTDSDKERRVEVYLVPKGATNMPPAAKNVKPVPEPIVKAIGCPK